jgi:hypothetical protein
MKRNAWTRKTEENEVIVKQYYIYNRKNKMYHLCVCITNFSIEHDVRFIHLREDTHRRLL